MKKTQRIKTYLNSPVLDAKSILAVAMVFVVTLTGATVIPDLVAPLISQAAIGAACPTTQGGSVSDGWCKIKDNIQYDNKVMNNLADLDRNLDCEKPVSTISDSGSDSGIVAVGLPSACAAKTTDGVKTYVDGSLINYNLYNGTVPKDPASDMSKTADNKDDPDYGKDYIKEYNIAATTYSNIRVETASGAKQGISEKFVGNDAVATDTSKGAGFLQSGLFAYTSCKYGAETQKSVIKDQIGKASPEKKGTCTLPNDPLARQLSYQGKIIDAPDGALHAKAPTTDPISANKIAASTNNAQTGALIYYTQNFYDSDLKYGEPFPVDADPFKNHISEVSGPTNASAQPGWTSSQAGQGQNIINFRQRPYMFFRKYSSSASVVFPQFSNWPTVPALNGALNNTKRAQPLMYDSASDVGYGTDGSKIKSAPSSDTWKPETITVEYDNVGDYTLANDIFQHEYTISAKLTVTNIIPFEGINWIASPGEKRPSLEFSNNLYSGFFYQNIQSFDVQIEYFHKYNPLKDKIVQAVSAAQCPDGISELTVQACSQANDGKPLVFSNKVTGSLKERNKTATVMSFFSLNRGGDDHAQTEFVGQLKVNDDGSKSFVENGVLTQNSSISFNGVCPTTAGGTGNITVVPNRPNSPGGSPVNKQCYRSGATYPSNPNLLNGTYYAYGKTDGTGATSIDQFEDKIATETYGNGGVSFPLAGSEFHFTLGGSKGHTFNSVASTSLFPKAQNQPNITVSQVVPGGGNQSVPDGENADPVVKAYFEKFGIDYTPTPALPSTLDKGKGSGYERRYDNDLDRLWALYPKVSTEAKDHSATYSPLITSNATWVAGDTPGTCNDEKGSTSISSIFAKGEGDSGEGSTDRGEYLNAHTALNVNAQFDGDCTAHKAYGMRTFYLYSDDLVDADAPLSALDMPEVYNINKDIVSHWITHKDNGVEGDTGLKFRPTWHAPFAIDDTGKYGFANSMGDPSKVKYPDAQNRKLGPATGADGSNPYGVNALTSTGGGVGTNASTLDKENGLCTSWDQDCGRTFYYYVNQRMLSASSDTSVGPGQIDFQDILPGGLELDESNTENDESPIILWDNNGKVVGYWANKGSDVIPESISFKGTGGSIDVDKTTLTAANTGEDFDRTSISIKLNDAIMKKIGNGVAEPSRIDGGATDDQQDFTFRLRVKMTDELVNKLKNPDYGFERDNSATVTYDYSKEYSNLKFNSVTNRVRVAAGADPVAPETGFDVFQLSFEKKESDCVAPNEGADKDKCSIAGAEFKLFPVDGPVGESLDLGNLTNTSVAVLDEEAYNTKFEGTPGKYAQYNFGKAITSSDGTNNTSKGSVLFAADGIGYPVANDTGDFVGRWYVVDETYIPIGYAAEDYTAWLVYVNPKSCPSDDAEADADAPNTGCTRIYPAEFDDSNGQYKFASNDPTSIITADYKGASTRVDGLTWNVYLSDPMLNKKVPLDGLIVPKVDSFTNLPVSDIRFNLRKIEVKANGSFDSIAEASDCETVSEENASECAVTESGTGWANFTEFLPGYYLLEESEITPENYVHSTEDRLLYFGINGAGSKEIAVSEGIDEDWFTDNWSTNVSASGVPKGDAWVGLTSSSDANDADGGGGQTYAIITADYTDDAIFHLQPINVSSDGTPIAAVAGTEAACETEYPGDLLYGSEAYEQNLFACFTLEESANNGQTFDLLELDDNSEFITENKPEDNAVDHAGVVPVDSINLKIRNIYRLKQIRAPYGYIPSDGAYYIYFDKTTKEPVIKYVPDEDVNDFLYWLFNDIGSEPAAVTDLTNSEEDEVSADKIGKEFTWLDDSGEKIKDSYPSGDIGVIKLPIPNTSTPFFHFNFSKWDKSGFDQTPRAYKPVPDAKFSLTLLSDDCKGIISEPMKSTADVNGEVAFNEGLHTGCYLLQETFVPDFDKVGGYRINSQKRLIRLSTDGNGDNSSTWTVVKGAYSIQDDQNPEPPVFDPAADANWAVNSDTNYVNDILAKFVDTTPAWTLINAGNEFITSDTYEDGVPILILGMSGDDGDAEKDAISYQDLRTFSINFAKVDAETGDPIVSFVQDDSGNGTFDPNDPSKRTDEMVATFTITSCDANAADYGTRAESGDCTEAYVTNAASDPYENAIIIKDDLPFNTNIKYKLVETKQPEGYEAPKGFYIFYFTVDTNNGEVKYVAHMEHFDDDGVSDANNGIPEEERIQLLTTKALPDCSLVHTKCTVDDLQTLYKYDRGMIFTWEPDQMRLGYNVPNHSKKFTFRFTKVDGDKAYCPGKVDAKGEVIEGGIDKAVSTWPGTNGETWLSGGSSGCFPLDNARFSFWNVTEDAHRILSEVINPVTGMPIYYNIPTGREGSAKANPVSALDRRTPDREVYSGREETDELVTSSGSDCVNDHTTDTHEKRSINCHFKPGPYLEPDLDGTSQHGVVKLKGVSTGWYIMQETKSPTEYVQDMTLYLIHLTPGVDVNTGKANAVRAVGHYIVNDGKTTNFAPGKIEWDLDTDALDSIASYQDSNHQDEDSSDSTLPQTLIKLENYENTRVRWYGGVNGQDNHEVIGNDHYNDRRYILNMFANDLSLETPSGDPDPGRLNIADSRYNNNPPKVEFVIQQALQDKDGNLILDATGNIIWISMESTSAKGGEDGWLSADSAYSLETDPVLEAKLYKEAWENTIGKDQPSPFKYDEICAAHIIVEPDTSPSCEKIYTELFKEEMRKGKWQTGYNSDGSPRYGYIYDELSADDRQKITSRIYEQAALESGALTGSNSYATLCTDACKTYFDENHPDYENKLYAATSFTSNSIYRLKGLGKDLVGYDSSLSNGAYYTIVLCDTIHQATNVSPNVPHCAEKTSLSNTNVFNVDMNSASSSSLHTLALDLSGSGDRELDHKTPATSNRRPTGGDSYGQTTALRSVNYPLNDTEGAHAQALNIVDVELEKQCKPSADLVPYIYYHKDVDDVQGTSMYKYAIDTCGNVVPAGLSLGYKSIYNEYVWDNFDWSDSASPLFGRAVLVIPVWKIGFNLCVIDKTCPGTTNGAPTFDSIIPPIILDRAGDTKYHNFGTLTDIPNRKPGDPTNKDRNGKSTGKNNGDDTGKNFDDDTDDDTTIIHLGETGISISILIIFGLLSMVGVSFKLRRRTGGAHRS